MLIPAKSFAGIVYMSRTGDPWGLNNGPGSEEAAMNTAFGVGGWTEQVGYSTSVFNIAVNSFVYVEGGNAEGLANFLNAGGRSALEAFVASGGKVFINAATNDTGSAFNVGFGVTLTPNAFSTFGQVTPAGITAGFANAGAGTSFNGGFLAMKRYPTSLPGPFS
jgi:hypothetical protein